MMANIYNNGNLIQRVYILSKKRYIFYLIVITFLFKSSNALANALQTVVDIYSTHMLHSQIHEANLRKGHTHFVLATGVYTLTKTILINASYISLSSQSGKADDVVIQGEGVFPNSTVGNLLRITGTHFTLTGITLQNSRNHLLQIAGESDADYPTVKNCIFRNAYQQLLKVSGKSDSSYSSDYGLVENTLFEYTAGIGPQYYIGGIDAHGIKHWLIRNNTFKHIASPDDRVAEHAIHIWSHSADNVVEHNTIIDSDRGIGFGMGTSPNSGGVIRYNTIRHSRNHHPNADVGIVLESSPNTQVYGNTVILEHTYPNAIEYRFEATKAVEIYDNTTNKAIRARDGATASVLRNNTLTSQ